MASVDIGCNRGSKYYSHIPNTVFGRPPPNMNHSVTKPVKKLLTRPISPREQNLVLHKVVQSTKLRQGKNQPAVLQQPQLNTRGNKVKNGYGIGMCLSLQNRLVNDQPRVLPSGRRRIQIRESNEGIDTLNTGRIGVMQGEEAKLPADIS